MNAAFGPYVAFCFDNAVISFGEALEAELDGVKGKKEEEINRKRQRVLAKWLGIPQKFRNPMAGAKVADQTFSVQGQG